MHLVEHWDEGGHSLEGTELNSSFGQEFPDESQPDQEDNMDGGVTRAGCATECGVCDVCLETAEYQEHGDE